MRILHLAGNLEDAGGILSVIRHLQTATAARGFQHSVFVHRRYVETRRPPLDYRFSRFVCSEMPSHLGIFWRAALALVEAKQLLARERFDLVHAHSRCGFLIAWGLAAALKRPVLFTNHDYARRLGMYRKAARAPRFHTVLLTPNMARHYGLEPQPPKLNVISACFGDSFLNEPLKRPQDNLSPSRTIRLVGVGSLLRWKKWDLLARALAQMPGGLRQRLEISIHGPVIQTDADSPKYERELREQLQASALAQSMFLRGPTQNVAEIIRQADWFVLPSTNEPCSVALMEALALGTPALLSSSGGNVDIVQPGKSGLFFKPDNPADLAAQLEFIAANRFSAAAPESIRESVRHRSATAVGEAYVRLYHDLKRLESHHARP